MIEKKDLPIFLEEVLKTLVPNIPNILISSRVEQNKKATQIFFVISRPRNPNQEIARMSVEFIYTLNKAQKPSLHIDTHIYILTGDLEDTEVKSLILLQAMCGFASYEFLNDPKSPF